MSNTPYLDSIAVQARCECCRKMFLVKYMIFGTSSSVMDPLDPPVWVCRKCSDEIGDFRPQEGGSP